MVWQGRKEILILWHQMVIGVASARVGCPSFMFFKKKIMLKVMHRTVWSYVVSDLVFWPHSLALVTSYFQLLLGCLQKLSSETVRSLSTKYHVWRAKWNPPKPFPIHAGHRCITSRHLAFATCMKKKLPRSTCHTDDALTVQNSQNSCVCHAQCGHRTREK